MANKPPKYRGPGSFMGVIHEHLNRRTVTGRALEGRYKNQRASVRHRHRPKSDVAKPLSPFSWSSDGDSAEEEDGNPWQRRPRELASEGVEEGIHASRSSAPAPAPRSRVTKQPVRAKSTRYADDDEDDGTSSEGLEGETGPPALKSTVQRGVFPLNTASKTSDGYDSYDSSSEDSPPPSLKRTVQRSAHPLNSVGKLSDEYDSYDSYDSDSEDSSPLLEPKQGQPFRGGRVVSRGVGRGIGNGRVSSPGDGPSRFRPQQSARAGITDEDLPRMVREEPNRYGAHAGRGARGVVEYSSRAGRGAGGKRGGAVYGGDLR